MKLYTEEQAKELIILTIILAQNMDSPTMIKEILDTATPIELPSDEEIIEAVEKEFPLLNVPDASNIDWTSRNGKRLGFLKCAKWMKEQILNKNK